MVDSRVAETQERVYNSMALKKRDTGYIGRVGAAPWREPPSLEIILPLVAGAAAELYGVVGAVVVAVEAGEATAVVLPSGLAAMAALYDVHGTGVGADAAAHAAVAHHVERLVGDEETLEEASHHVGHHPRQCPLGHVHYALAPLQYALHDARQPLGRPLLLLPFPLGLVHVHERQAHVRFRHDERPGRRHVFHAERPQRGVAQDGLAQVAERIAHAIARRAEAVGIGRGGGVDDQSGNELPEEGGHTPAMHGKDKAQPFAGLQVVFLGMCHRLGHKEELLSQGLGKPQGSPSRVSRSREIEYHLAFMLPSMYKRVSSALPLVRTVMPFLKWPGKRPLPE